ncbi:hypothetical protein Fmac_004379 [Flemingia macrophylla]|uniref:RING-type E3 ubiquitin transferase n=1 Tax=Flemingia macrophylla TaxID=520843 RepID=A0ABD1N4Y6_9FABA
MDPHPTEKPPPQPVVASDRGIPLHEHHGHPLRVAMLVMACMVGFVTFLFALSLLIRFFSARRRSRTARDAPILFHVNGDPPTSDNYAQDLAVVHPIWYIRTVGLQQSLIDSITVFSYRKEDGIIDGTECSVCLGEFEEDESLRLLPKCSHAFHIPCIDTWLLSHKTCPMCRAPVLHHHAPLQTDHPNVSHDIQEVLQLQNSDDHRETSHDERGPAPASDLAVDDLSSLLPSSSGSELEEGTKPLRRTVSVDSSMVLFGDVAVDLDSDQKVGSSGKSVGKLGTETSTSSTPLYKVASSGRALQKRAISMRRSFSHSRKFLSSTHSRSQSSTLPL